MTERELELWFEGQADFWDRVVDLMAWAQANLINIHVPRGKGKMSIEKLRPKRATKPRQKTEEERQEEMEIAAEVLIDNPRDLRSARERRRLAAQERADAVRYWQSDEGRRLSETIKMIRE